MQTSDLVSQVGDLELGIAQLAEDNPGRIDLANRVVGVKGQMTDAFTQFADFVAKTRKKHE